MDPLLTLLGITAACMTTLAFIPQVLQIIRTRDTSSISLGMYLMFVVGIALWLTYGIALGDLPIILANTITLLLACTVLTLKLRYK
ncbi:SemiSWEET transporter [Balneatrix alpica]|uniref:SemiSWEET transporter n=1 Tax=Balneatrix alpica TaxID=75684 RepID=A0ABV5ZAH4_9GAMM|nr:SemiSWEET transporter [Balneatrix alpica]